MNDALPLRPSSALNARIAELEKQFASMQSQPTDKQRKTMVVGGLIDFDSMQSAWDWLSSKMTALSLLKPIDKYCKGDFQSMLFVVFETEGMRDQAINGLRNAKIPRGSKNIWSKPDQPLYQRAME